MLSAGDLLISLTGNCGRVGILTEDFLPAALNQRVSCLRIKDNSVLKSFLFHLLNNKAFENKCMDEATGAAQKNMSTEWLKKQEFSVPPLEEQKRIVKILDEKFAQLETIKANAQTNLQNAKDLFQSQLAKAFSNTTWEKKKLGDFSEITDGDHLPPPKSPRGFPFITISNIDKDFHTINFTDTFYVPETYFANLKENRKPKKGDVLYTVTGSYGIPVIVDGSVEFCFQRHIGLIRPSSEINSNYLYYWILSPEAKKIADDVATGTAQKTVSLSSLRNFEIPLPPLPEQKRIVKELDTLSEKVRQLQEIYTKQIANCAELKQSLLQKAFEGEL
jgi:type I restriction enzyme S subunit